MEWAKIKRYCPLCKMSFKSILHNVRTIYDYEQVYLDEVTSTDVLGSNRPPDFSATIQEQQRFRYSTTLSNGRPRSSTADQAQQARAHPAAPGVTSQHPARSSTYSNRVSVRQRRTEASMERRRLLYFDGLRTSLPGTQDRRKREISCRFFQSNPAATHRLAPWVLRDLRVILHHDMENVNFLTGYILSLVSRVDMQSSEFSSELQPFLTERTSTFVRELVSFAQSPFDITGYDSACVYDSLGAERPAAEDSTERIVRETDQLHLQQAIFEELAASSWDTPRPTHDSDDQSPSAVLHSNWSDDERREEDSIRLQSVGSAGGVTVSANSNRNRGPSRDDSLVITAVYSPSAAARLNQPPPITVITLDTSSDSDNDDSNSGAIADPTEPEQAASRSRQSEHGSPPPVIAAGGQISVSSTSSETPADVLAPPQSPKTEPRSPHQSPQHDEEDLVSLCGMSDTEMVPVNCAPAQNPVRNSGASVGEQCSSVPPMPCENGGHVEKEDSSSVEKPKELKAGNVSNKPSQQRAVPEGIQHNESSTVQPSDQPDTKSKSQHQRRHHVCERHRKSSAGTQDGAGSFRRSRKRSRSRSRSSGRGRDEHRRHRHQCSHHSTGSSPGSNRYHQRRRRSRSHSSSRSTSRRQQQSLDRSDHRRRARTGSSSSRSSERRKHTHCSSRSRPKEERRYRRQCQTSSPPRLREPRKHSKRSPSRERSRRSERSLSQEGHGCHGLSNQRQLDAHDGHPAGNSRSSRSHTVQQNHNDSRYPSTSSSHHSSQWTTADRRHRDVDSGRSATSGKSKLQSLQRHSRTSRSHGILRDESPVMVMSDEERTSKPYRSEEKRKQTISSVVIRKAVVEGSSGPSDADLDREVRMLEEQQQSLEGELAATNDRALSILTRLEDLAGAEGAQDAATVLTAVAGRSDTDEVEVLQQEFSKLEEDILAAKRALLKVMNRLEHKALLHNQEAEPPSNTLS